MKEITLSFLQGIILILIAPIFIGCLNWAKARLQGRPRKWNVILHPYRDFYKLFYVPAVRPQTTSWLFTMTPWVVFISYGLLAFTLPVFWPPLLRIDVILLIYILGLARFSLALA